jgi:excisionase family DNA binding protein
MGTDDIASRLKDVHALVRPLLDIGEHEFVSIAEAAARTKTGQETLRRAVRAGRLQAFGSRGRLRVRIADVLRPYAVKRKEAQNH